MRTINKSKLDEVFKFIEDYQSQKGRSPSYREISHNVIGLSLATAHSYVNILQKKGLISKNDIGNISTPIETSINQTIIAPIVGNIACGNPILAEQNIEESYRLPIALFGDQQLYGLKAKGDSMVNVGIYDGDTVFYLPCNAAENGDIVVALIEDSATIKTYYKRNGKIVLHPENPEYADIYPETVIIQGIVKHTIHSF